MIGRVVDSLVSVFSPRAAARRVHARRVYEMVSQRAYDAAKKNRTNAHWKTSNRSADLELFSDADVVRSRVRDLVRNNAYAGGILRALVRNVVGQGIRPQARTDSESFDQIAEQLFDRWAKRADVTGRLSFWELQRLAYREMHEAGEVLVHFVETDDPTRPLPLALELVEADRLASDQLFTRSINPETGNEIRRGVEVDGVGRPVAYWLYPKHPNDINALWSKAQRFDAGEFLHLYKQERVGQTRGISTLAPVVRWLKDLHYYVENELQASAVASCFTAVIKTVGGAADGSLLDTIDSDASDTDGNQFEYLQPGMVARLMPGEEIEVINPSRPNAQADAWITLMLRSLAVGTGISYERLARDYSRTNFSSNRASDLEDRREFRPEQDFLITHLCEPVWNRFIESAVIAGKEGFPDEFDLLRDYEDVTSHIWQPPGWEWVDPQKEAAASQLALESNLTTLADELGKRGKDLREVLEQRAREKQMLEELGLTATPETTGASADDDEEAEAEAVAN